MATETGPSDTTFIKQLTSSDRQCRDRALEALRAFLHHHKEPFTTTDFLKLWKGLYWSLWLQDKPRNQQQLARHIASLADELPDRAQQRRFFEAFWLTMARVWSSIDSHRINKFMYLVRLSLGKVWECCVQSEWDVAWTDMLQAGPLDAQDASVPDGLRFHLVDIYVDELCKADEKRQSPLNEALRPLRKLCMETSNKALRRRAQEALQDERLAEWPSEIEDDGEEFEGFD
ncbi:nucleolar protein-like protein NOP52 variant [Piedraia hortae CBS 480.64]|uniref:Nucleolar protein-like protein NOP52 variant n=1 Tax=Piedraia hortae CBS 480.64 TaxID=1314780 RepID=A0A6A7BRX9_9PEZI|nr:nucleolar protein-like protein NOP52 variant [Piedraia hortae CBS 480.64]